MKTIAKYYLKIMMLKMVPRPLEGPRSPPQNRETPKTEAGNGHMVSSKVKPQPSYYRLLKAIIGLRKAFQREFSVLFL